MKRQFRQVGVDGAVAGGGAGSSEDSSLTNATVTSGKASGNYPYSGQVIISAAS